MSILQVNCNVARVTNDVRNSDEVYRSFVLLKPDTFHGSRRHVPVVQTYNKRGGRNDGQHTRSGGRHG